MLPRLLSCARPPAAGTRNAQYKLRVSEVPPGTTAAALKAAFDEFGALEAELAGAMAFVSFSSQEQLDNALKTGAVRALNSPASLCCIVC